MLKISLLLWVAAAASAATPIVIDTDMGSDDVMAIAFLLAQRDVPIEAITVVNGLAHVSAGAANARRLVEASGRHDVLVLEGRTQALRRTADFPHEWRAASDLPLNDRAPLATSFEPADTWLAHRVNDAARPVRVLALGPLTNLALALTGGHAAVEEIVIMGGAFHVAGNLGDGGAYRTSNTTAEWNFFADPDAAARVFECGAPLRVVPLDATSRVKLDVSFIERFHRGSIGPLAGMVDKVLAGERELVAQGIFYAWDPLAAVALLDPSAARWTRAHVSIRRLGKEAGRSVIEEGLPNARIALDASRPDFERVFLATFARRN